MGNTLYISDLDGTLLRTDGTLSAYARAAIVRLQERGVLISCATGRSLVSVRKLWEGIPLRCPVAVGNGASIYSLRDRAYLHRETIPESACAELDAAIKGAGVHGFLYGIRGGQEWMFYREGLNAAGREYLAVRRGNFGDRCGPYESIVERSSAFGVLYVTLYGELARLETVNEKLETIPAIHGLYSQRADDPLYFLDIVSSACSKSGAIRRIQELVGADEVVAFGDHHNDLDMLAVADRSYVPDNAIPEAKEIATGVLGPCDEDSVIRFIEEDARRSTGAVCIGS